MVTYNKDVHRYDTRSKNDFRISHKKSGWSRNSLFHKGFTQYNPLPMSVKNENNYEVFKKKLRQFIKEEV